SKYLGHYVAGNLAARHNITVTLHNSPGHGITATINVPPTLLTELPESMTGAPAQSDGAPGAPELRATMPTAPMTVVDSAPLEDVPVAPFADVPAAAATTQTTSGLAKRTPRSPGSADGPTTRPAETPSDDLLRTLSQYTTNRQDQPDTPADSPIPAAPAASSSPPPPPPPPLTPRAPTAPTTPAALPPRHHMNDGPGLPAFLLTPPEGIPSLGSRARPESRPSPAYPESPGDEDPTPGRPPSAPPLSLPRRSPAAEATPEPPAPNPVFPPRTTPTSSPAPAPSPERPMDAPFLPRHEPVQPPAAAASAEPLAPRGIFDQPGDASQFSNPNAAFPSRPASPPPSFESLGNGHRDTPSVTTSPPGGEHTIGGLTRRVRGAQMPTTDLTSIRRREPSGDSRPSAGPAPRPKASSGPRSVPQRRLEGRDPSAPYRSPSSSPFEGRSGRGAPVPADPEPVADPAPADPAPAAESTAAVDSANGDHRAADEVYSFLSSFTAGVQRGLDESRDDPDAEDDSAD
ncbi:MAG TPA: hypothetical protein VGJ86_20255, partial [Acidimicrobiales bacterium]